MGWNESGKGRCALVPHAQASWLKPKASSIPADRSRLLAAAAGSGDDQQEREA